MVKNNIFYLSLSILILLLYCNYKLSSDKNVTEHFYYKNDVTKMSKTEISNEISVTIENETKNLTKIFNETVNKTSTSSVSEAAQSVTIASSGKNKMETGDINLDGDADIEIKQDAKIKTENQAIMNIINDTSQLQKMASTMSDEIANKTKNDSAAKASLDTLNALKETKKTAGGPEGMIDSVMGAIKGLGSSLLGGGNTREQNETLIKNKINTKMSSKTTNDTNISNIVKNQTDSMVKNIQENKCGFDTSGANEMKLGNINAKGRSKLKLSQNLDITAFNKCIVGAANTNKMITEITGFQGSKTTTDTTNIQKAESDVKSKNVSEKTEEAKSAIMSSVDNIVDKGTALAGSVVSGSFMMLGFGLVIVAGLAFVFKDTISAAAGSQLGFEPPPPSGSQHHDNFDGGDEGESKYFSLGQEGGKCDFDIKLYDPIFKVIIIIVILNVVISNKN